MKVKLTLDLNDVNAILAVLGKLPYEQVAGLIGEVRMQIQDHQPKVPLNSDRPPPPLSVSPA